MANAKSFKEDLYNQMRRRYRIPLKNSVARGFLKVKKHFLAEVRNHPISLDLESRNSFSKFLGGVGSLYGFLGFDDGEDPVDELLDFLEESINLRDATSQSARTFATFDYLFPTKDDFAAENSLTLAWERDLAWPIAIEEGISGLPYFLNISGAGRSNEGFQVKSSIRPQDFSPVPYLTPLIQNFRKNLSRVI